MSGRPNYVDFEDEVEQVDTVSNNENEIVENSSRIVEKVFDTKEDADSTSLNGIHENIKGTMSSTSTYSG